MRLRTLIAIAVLGLLLAVPAAEGRSTGPEFGSGGLLPDGAARIIAFGRSFGIAKLQLRGVPEIDFGRGGHSRVSFPRFRDARSADGAVQLGGRLVLAGYVSLRCRPPRGGVCGRRVALARFLANGRPDPSFGRGGKVVAGDGRATAVVTTSRRILVAGRTGAGLPMVSRFLFDGRPDPSFGDRGRVVLRRLPAEVGGLEAGRAEALAIQADGRVLVSLVPFPVATPSRPGMVRLEADGRLDRSFGTDGFLVAPIGLGGGAFPGLTPGPGAPTFMHHRVGFAPLPDGSILLALATVDYPAHLALLRLRPDGSPDPEFGAGGVARAPASVLVRFGVELIATPGGGAVVGVAGYDGATVLRFLPDGNLDPSFGSGGMAPTLPSWGARASISILGDGSVAVADDRRETSGLLVARYGPDGAPLMTTTLP